MAKRLRITLDLELDESKVPVEETAKNLIIHTMCQDNMVLIESNFKDSEVEVDDYYQPEIKDMEFRVETYDTNQPCCLTFRDQSTDFERIVEKHSNNMSDKEMEELRDESWHNRNCL